MRYIAPLFAGAFLCNSILHLIAGNALSDTVCEAESYRQSSPFINFIWSAFDLVVGMGLISFHPVLVGLNSDCLAVSAGTLLLGTYLSHHFGNVRGPEAKP
jgi:hypothetical protein